MSISSININKIINESRIEYSRYLLIVKNVLQNYSTRQTLTERLDFVKKRKGLRGTHDYKYFFKVVENPQFNQTHFLRLRYLVQSIDPSSRLQYSLPRIQNRVGLFCILLRRSTSYENM